MQIGGDMRCRGEVEVEVGIANPVRGADNQGPMGVVRVKEGALATSGGWQRGYEIGGKHYSHVIDPRTGRTAEGVEQATVIAGTAEDADALATAFQVMEPGESVRLAEALEGVECLIVGKNGEVVESEGWAGYVEEQEVKKEEGEAADFELKVSYEVNRPEAEGGRYRKPYVAVWVEDEEGKTVRTLSLMVSMGGPGPRWITDLKRWYKDDRERRRTDKKDLLYTISKPTRPPGKYEVVWDGKDDHGKVRPRGKYTVLVEAAREHGTYQLIRQEVELGGESFEKEAEGNVEVKSATVAYRPVEKGAGE